MILYLLKSTFLLLIFSLIYKISLERKKNLKFNRYFLITSLFIALLFPLIDFQIQVETPIIVNTKQLVLEQLPALEITSIEKQTNLNFNYSKIAYIMITAVFMIKFLANLVYLIHLKRKSTILKSRFGIIALNHKIKSPFSFLNTIFVNQNHWQDNEIETAILHHEQGHVVQKHSLDVLFIELLKIFMWFQPFLYIYKRFIQENHEYLADAYSLSKNTNIIQYQKSILNYYTTTENVVALSSSIHFNNLKKRFIMMKNTKKEKVWSTVFYTLTALITYSGFIGIEAKAKEIKKFETVLDQKIEKISNPIKKSTFKQLENEEIKADNTNNQNPIILNYIKREKSSGNFSHKDNVYFYVVDENLKVSIYNRYGVIQNEKDFTYELKAVSKEEKEKLTLDELKKSSQVKNDHQERKEIKKTYTEAHSFVEKKAMPKEGFQRFIQDFVREFKVPSNVNLDEIKFRLRFIVEKDGSFSNIHAANGSSGPNEFDEILHKEAIRTLQTMPKWNPAEHEGEIVASTFTLPITIKNKVQTEVKEQ